MPLSPKPDRYLPAVTERRNAVQPQQQRLWKVEERLALAALPTTLNWQRQTHGH